MTNHDNASAFWCLCWRGGGLHIWNARENFIFGNSMLSTYMFLNRLLRSLSNSIDLLTAAPPRLREFLQPSTWQALHIWISGTFQQTANTRWPLGHQVKGLHDKRKATLPPQCLFHPAPYRRVQQNHIERSATYWQWKSRCRGQWGAGIILAARNFRAENREKALS